jgi:hypothetical protein
VTGRSPPTRRTLALGFAFGVAALFPPDRARAEPSIAADHVRAAPAGFSGAERERIRAGSRVERPLRFSERGGAYVGGIAYQVVDQGPSAVLAALLDVRLLPEMLPGTHSARLLPSRSGLTRVELEQGHAPFIARYTVVLDAASGSEVRFWIDASRPHDLRDVFGFFRAEAWGRERTLVTVGAAVDLGSSIMRGFLEPRVQRVVLSSVTGIRDFLEPRRIAAVGYGECSRCRSLP